MYSNDLPHQIRDVCEQQSGEMGVTLVVGVTPVPLIGELFCCFLHMQAVDKVDSQRDGQAESLHRVDHLCWKNQGLSLEESDFCAPAHVKLFMGAKKEVLSKQS